MTVSKFLSFCIVSWGFSGFWLASAYSQLLFQAHTKHATVILIPAGSEDYWLSKTNPADRSQEYESPSLCCSVKQLYLSHCSEMRWRNIWKNNKLLVFFIYLLISFTFHPARISSERLHFTLKMFSHVNKMTPPWNESLGEQSFFQVIFCFYQTLDKFFLPLSVPVLDCLGTAAEEPMKTQWNQG